MAPPERPDIIQRLSSSLASLSRNSLVRLGLAALGFTSVLLLWLIAPAIEPTHETFYRWSGSPAAFFVPVALDFGLCWLVLWLFLLLARAPGRRRFLVWSFLAFATLWVGKQDYLFMVGLPPRFPYEWTFLLGFLGTALLTIFWFRSVQPIFESVIAFATTILIFLGFFGLTLVGRLAWYGIQGALSDHGELHHESSAVQPPAHRIVWVIFDELSYEQVYEHRYAGLKLPAFDALAAQSTVFTDVVPVFNETKFAIPGLIAGVQPYAARYPTLASSPQLVIKTRTDPEWHPFNPRDTVFQDALNAGDRTGLVGWYNPYCQMLTGVLDSCTFISTKDINNTFSPLGTVLSNTIQPAHKLIVRAYMILPPGVKAFLSHFMRPLTRHPTGRDSHVDDYESLNAAAQRLLQDRTMGFVLLHYSIPHPPGIFNRRTGHVSPEVGANYLDNLALADQCLAGIRATLEQQGEWDSSTVVVMGDHGWRTTMFWKIPGGAWTAEEDAASHGGVFDTRPAYIVKLPGQTAPARIDSLFRAFHTRELLDRIMTNQLKTPADLAAFAARVR